MKKGGGKKSVGAVIFWIVLMNLVFSFDSILSAMALTHDFWIMATAIVISGILMILLADTVSSFLKKNRLYLPPRIMLSANPSSTSAAFVSRRESASVFSAGTSFVGLSRDLLVSASERRTVDQPDRKSPGSADQSLKRFQNFRCLETTLFLQVLLRPRAG